MKTCFRCKIEKSLDEFSIHRKRADGRQVYCKECSKSYDRDRWKNRNTNSFGKRSTPEGRAHRQALKYNTTKEIVVELQIKYDGKCWICRKKLGTHVDHDHVTGKVRGWLCQGCNFGLGFMQDDIEILQAAILYLESPWCSKANG